MENYKLFTDEQRIELTRDAKQRMDSSARAWLENPKVKATLLRVNTEEEEAKRAS